MTGAVIAQTVGDRAVPETNLDLPTNLTIFGKLDPNVRKPTAIVNDTVITGTDVDQRVALIVSANQLQLDAKDLEQLKLQMLRQLIDETLQIQEAKAHEITITTPEIDQAFDRVAKNFGREPADFRAYLRTIGSSDRSMRRQIQGELAWQRYLRRRVEPIINVGDEEVAGILKRLEEAKGTEEYHLREIYMSATADIAPAVFSKGRGLIQEMQTGKAPFEYYARTFSEATTKGVGGDLGWVRGAQLPTELATASADMQVGQIAGPIEVPGGFSILYMVDKRKVLTADPRDAKLNLKQMTLRFPPGTTEAQASVRAADFAKVVQGINGCGGVAKAAAGIGAEVVDNDQITIRDLPGPLQEIMVKLQVGQASPPFGSATDGVRTLVLCGRDDVAGGSLPTAEQVQGQLEQQRVNLRAQQILRDLRRDAIIEYR
ncbi:peptidylprolyl isomerase [uncultured Sphingomonas sp.]|uniref:peptidylprolyl isomerase n=1 Tax=uncultured Sphingomonas sp. TaxID=158754 RepID=UPI0035CA420D